MISQNQRFLEILNGKLSNRRNILFLFIHFTVKTEIEVNIIQSAFPTANFTVVSFMMYEQNRKIQSPQSVDEIRQIKSCGIRFSGEFGQCVDDQQVNRLAGNPLRFGMFKHVQNFLPVLRLRIILTGRCRHIPDNQIGIALFPVGFILRPVRISKIDQALFDLIFSILEIEIEHFIQRIMLRLRNSPPFLCK